MSLKTEGLSFFEQSAISFRLIQKDKQQKKRSTAAQDRHELRECRGTSDRCGFVDIHQAKESILFYPLGPIRQRGLWTVDNF